MKLFIKFFIGFIKAKIYNLKAKKRIYIGRYTKVINGKRIKIGNNVSIRPDCFLCCDKESDIEIKDKVDIGARNRIISGKRIVIEESVQTGPNVFISDIDHKYDMVGIPIKEQGTIIKDGEGIKIGYGSWIGTNSVIIGNVTIGKGVAIGANSVVTKDLPDYCVAVGSPARIIKKYNQNTRKWEKVENSNVG